MTNTIRMSGYTIDDLISDLDGVNNQYPLSKDNERLNNERKGQFGELVIGYALQNFAWSVRPNYVDLRREFVNGSPSPSNNHGMDWVLSMDSYPDMYVEVKNLGQYTWIDKKFYDECIKDRFTKHCNDKLAIKVCVVNKSAITNKVRQWFVRDGIFLILVDGQIEHWNYNKPNYIRRVYQDYIKGIESLYVLQGYQIEKHTPIFDSLWDDLGRTKATIQCLRMNVPKQIIMDEFGYKSRTLDVYKSKYI